MVDNNTHVYSDVRSDLVQTRMTSPVHMVRPAMTPGICQRCAPSNAIFRSPFTRKVSGKRSQHPRNQSG